MTRQIIHKRVKLDNTAVKDLDPRVSINPLGHKTKTRQIFLLFFSPHAFGHIRGRCVFAPAAMLPRWPPESVESGRHCSAGTFARRRRNGLACTPLCICNMHLHKTQVRDTRNQHFFSRVVFYVYVSAIFLMADMIIFELYSTISVENLKKS